MSSENLIRRALARTGFTGRISSATTVNGTAIDRTGYEDLLVVVSVATFDASSATMDIKVQMDGDGAFSDPTDITGAAFTQLDETGDDIVRVARINIQDAEQYLRPVITTAGTLTTVDLSVMFLLGDFGRTLGSGVGYEPEEFEFEVSA